MQAVAFYDFRLTEEQFGRLTPLQFWALWDRRAAAFRQQCYLQGIVASAVFNSQRTDSKQHLFDCWDFVPRSRDEAQREEIVLMLRQQLNNIPADHQQAARRKWEEKLQEIGRADTEEILTQVFAWIN
jgi:hypothetical protein